MPRVRFARDFDCHCKPGVFIAYRAGFSGLIPRAHAERARNAGALDEPQCQTPDRPPGQGADRGAGSGGDGSPAAGAAPGAGHRRGGALG